MTMTKDKFKNFKIYFFNVIWVDPVWSKVIAGAILAIFAGTGALLLALIKSIGGNISYREGLSQLLQHLFERRSLVVNNLFLYFLIVILVFTVFKSSYVFIQDVLVKINEGKADSNDQETAEEITLEINENSAVFFTSRLSDAFPGQRGLTWYDNPKIVIERLSILLRKPIKFKATKEYHSDPIWWFRGGSCMFVSKYKSLSRTKVLIGIDELEIKRIAVNIDPLYYKSFVYIEAKAEKQTGLYSFTKEKIDDHVETFGYAHEEYGLIGKNHISRQEFDDGAAQIDGKVISTQGAELRCRYLTDYNFVIAAKQSPYNSHRFSGESGKYFDGILAGKVNHAEFFQFMDTFVKGESLT